MGEEAQVQILPVWIIPSPHWRGFYCMKTDACSQTDQKHHIKRWLDALRIQAEKLEELALKTAEYADSDVQMDQDRRPTMARR
jgi:hypothetical protein